MPQVLQLSPPARGWVGGFYPASCCSLFFYRNESIFLDMPSTAGTDSTAAQSSLATVVTKRIELVTALESLKSASVPQVMTSSALSGSLEGARSVPSDPHDLEVWVAQEQTERLATATAVIASLEDDTAVKHFHSIGCSELLLQHSLSFLRSANGRPYCSPQHPA